VNRRILDISLPLSVATPAWPGDPPFAMTRLADMASGDMATVSHLSMSAHAGTHVDAPAHFLTGGADVADLPLEAMIGPAYLADAVAAAGPPRRGAGATPPSLTASDLAAIGIPDGVERLLLRTRGPGHEAPPAGVFDPEFVALAPDAARWLVERRLRLVGIDGPSIAPMADAGTTHRVLLRAGVVIVEGLDLRDAAAGHHDLVCLPLRVPGAEGAPARAVLISPPGAAGGKPIARDGR